MNGLSRSFKRVVCDDHALDFRGAFVDGGDARVAVEALDFEILRVAVAAVNLKCVVAYSDRGLRGEEIPIEGRITAVADVFDALSSTRPYKPSFPLEKCFAIIEQGRGEHFDPSVVDAFLARKADVIKIHKAYADTESPVLEEHQMSCGEAESAVSAENDAAGPRGRDAKGASTE